MGHVTNINIMTNILNGVPRKTSIVLVREPTSDFVGRTAPIQETRSKKMTTSK